MSCYTTSRRFPITHTYPFVRSIPTYWIWGENIEAERKVLKGTLISVVWGGRIRWQYTTSTFHIRPIDLKLKSTLACSYIYRANPSTINVSLHSPRFDYLVKVTWTNKIRSNLMCFFLPLRSIVFGWRRRLWSLLLVSGLDPTHSL